MDYLLNCIRKIFYFYKTIDKMKRKEAYRKALPVFGSITLTYLISYYEDLEMYEESAIILEVLKEHDKTYPTRYDNISIKRYCNDLFEKTGKNIPTTNIEFNIKNYASKVMEYVEKESN